MSETIVSLNRISQEIHFLQLIKECREKQYERKLKELAFRHECQQNATDEVIRSFSYCSPSKFAVNVSRPSSHQSLRLRTFDFLLDSKLLTSFLDPSKDRLMAWKLLRVCKTFYHSTSLHNTKVIIGPEHMDHILGLSFNTLPHRLFRSNHVTFVSAGKSVTSVNKMLWNAYFKHILCAFSNIKTLTLDNVSLLDMDGIPNLPDTIEHFSPVHCDLRSIHFKIPFPRLTSLMCKWKETRGIDTFLQTNPSIHTLFLRGTAHCVPPYRLTAAQHITTLYTVPRVDLDDFPRLKTLFYVNLKSLDDLQIDSCCPAITHFGLITSTRLPFHWLNTILSRFEYIFLCLNRDNITMMSLLLPRVYEQVKMIHIHDHYADEHHATFKVLFPNALVVFSAPSSNRVYTVENKFMVPAVDMYHSMYYNMMI